MKKALRKETVSFVKMALNQAIDRAENRAPIVNDQELDDDPAEHEIERHAYLTAVKWVTSSLLHEIHPRLGAIKVEARRSVALYDESNLKRRIDALASVLSGIEEIRKASIVQEIKEFAIYDLISTIVAEATDGADANVFLQGSRDLFFSGDPNLLILAVGNALKNSIEASASVGHRQPIVISWGVTDVDYWITILDQGPGVSGPTEAAFEIGRTTKSGHRGFGLAIARQAMVTLDGSISLQSASAGGARVDIRWFK
ncbi:ATP-binding protein [Methylorubrum aminovorans]